MRFVKSLYLGLWNKECQFLPCAVQSWGKHCFFIDMPGLICHRAKMPQNNLRVPEFCWSLRGVSPTIRFECFVETGDSNGRQLNLKKGWIVLTLKLRGESRNWKIPTWFAYSQVIWTAHQDWPIAWTLKLSQISLGIQAVPLTTALLMIFLQLSKFPLSYYGAWAAFMWRVAVRRVKCCNTSVSVVLSLEWPRQSVNRDDSTALRIPLCFQHFWEFALELTLDVFISSQQSIFFLSRWYYWAEQPLFWPKIILYISLKLNPPS